MAQPQTIAVGTRIQLIDRLNDNKPGDTYEVKQVKEGSLGPLYLTYGEEEERGLRFRWNEKEGRFVVTGLRSEFDINIIAGAGRPMARRAMKAAAAPQAVAPKAKRGRPAKKAA